MDGFAVLVWTQKTAATRCIKHCHCYCCFCDLYLKGSTTSMNLVLLSAINCHCRCYNEEHNHDEDYSTATTILYATGAAVSISGGFSLNTPRRANREMISTRTAPSSSTGTTCSYMTKKRMLMSNMLHCLAGNDNDHVCMSRKPSERLPGNC